MQKSINIQTRFQWRISPPRKEGEIYVGICDRLGITVEAFDTETLVEVIQSNMQALFLDLYYGKPNGTEFFDHAWKHSIEFKIDEGINFLYVVPGPIIVE